MGEAVVGGDQGMTAGERLIIEPVAARSLLALLDSWEDDLDDAEAFPEIEDLPPGPVDI